MGSRCSPSPPRATTSRLMRCRRRQARCRVWAHRSSEERLRTMWRIIRLGVALAFVGTSAAEAADAQNRFQPYGLGRAYCKRFIEICEGKQEDCKQTGPWLDGYITAYNAIDKGTFDIFEWQSPELFAQLVFNVCKQHPDAVFVQVVNELIRVVMVPDKLTTASERVKIGDG